MGSSLTTCFYEKQQYMLLAFGGGGWDEGSPNVNGRNQPGFSFPLGHWPCAMFQFAAWVGLHSYLCKVDMSLYGRCEDNQKTYRKQVKHEPLSFSFPSPGRTESLYSRPLLSDISAWKTTSYKISQWSGVTFLPFCKYPIWTTRLGLNKRPSRMMSVFRMNVQPLRMLWRRPVFLAGKPTITGTEITAECSPKMALVTSDHTAAGFVTTNLHPGNAIKSSLDYFWR